jgi:hypothetical protein
MSILCGTDLPDATRRSNEHAELFGHQRDGVLKVAITTL